MKRRRNSIQVLGRLLLLAVVLTFASPGYVQAGPQPSNVNVVNTPSVTVSNPVTVDTSAAPLAVQDVDEAKKQLFQWSGNIVIQSGSFQGVETFTVPRFKRLVIQFVSVRASADPDQRMRAEVHSLSNLQDAFFFVPLTDLGVFGSSRVFDGAQPTQMVADPETQLTFLVARSSRFGASWAISVFFSGYLVDAS